MNRRFEIVLALALAELTAVALAVGAWRWPEMAGPVLDPMAHRRLLLAFLGVALCPVWLAVGWAAMRRRAASLRPAASPDQLRYAQIGLAAATVFLIVLQAWHARNVIAGEPLGRETMLRLTTIFAGLLVAVQGNFLGKARPPSGERAPDPAAWTRAMLRIGWVNAAVGLGLAVCAVAIPIRILFPVFLASFLALLANSILQRRGLRPAGG